MESLSQDRKDEDLDDILYPFNDDKYGDLTEITSEMISALTSSDCVSYLTEFQRRNGEIPEPKPKITIIWKHGDNVYDWYEKRAYQGRIPSCVAHAVAELFNWEDPNSSPCVPKIYFDQFESSLVAQGREWQAISLFRCMMYVVREIIYEEDNDIRKLLEKDALLTIDWTSRTPIPKPGNLTVYMVEPQNGKLSSPIIEILKKHNKPVAVGLNSRGRNHVITVFGFDDKVLYFKDSANWQEHGRKLKFAALRIELFDEQAKEAYYLMSSTASREDVNSNLDNNQEERKYGDPFPKSTQLYNFMIGTSISPSQLPGLKITKGTDSLLAELSLGGKTQEQVQVTTSETEETTYSARATITWPPSGSLECQRVKRKGKEGVSRSIPQSTSPLLGKWSNYSQVWGFKLSKSMFPIDLINVVKYTLDENKNVQDGPEALDWEVCFDKSRLKIPSFKILNWTWSQKKRFYALCKTAGETSKKVTLEEEAFIVFNEFPGKQTDLAKGFKFTFSKNEQRFCLFFTSCRLGVSDGQYLLDHMLDQSP